MSELEKVQAAIDALRREVEGRYPLTIGAVSHQPISGDHDWHIDYIIQAHRHGPMSLLDLSGLEEWIKSKTGFAVLIDTRPLAEGGEGTSRAAAE
jgi:hypothetical protein